MIQLLETIEEDLSMTDGMMEAYREGERNKAQTRFFCALIRYLKKPGRVLRMLLYRRGRETDEIRGGMVGTTHWADWLDRNLKEITRRRRGTADTAWMRLLWEIKDETWRNDADDNHNTINLSEELTALSPFKNKQIIFPGEGTVILTAGRSVSFDTLARDAFKRAGIDPREDQFAFVVRHDHGEVELEPIWLRQTTFQVGTRARNGPVLRSVLA